MQLIEIGPLRLGLPARGMPVIDPAAGGLAPRINGMDVVVPSAVLLPTGGMGFFGWPAIAGHRDGRAFTLEFSDWQVSGKTLTARDRVSAIDIAIEIGGTGGVTTLRSVLKNSGADDYTLDRCMAGSYLVGESETSLTSFTGMWGREFHSTTEALPHGLWMQENRRGRTSHDRFPGLRLGQRTFHLGWSGNHVIAIDRLDDGCRLVHMGELFEPGEMRLAPGESYESPVAYASDDHVALPTFLKNRLGNMRPRPVLLNTWEGNYFDHKMESLKAQADAAAEMGIERFVLDDGWFGRRDDDASSLGDWFIDTRKYPQGLGPLIDHVAALGMEFGIWFEPEMVNPDSDLYRAHPDWVLQVTGRPLLPSRNQLVLDLTRPEVSDHLFGCMDAVLSAHKIAYIKWDMNRDITHAGDRHGRAATSRQTRAVYALMDRLRMAYPDLEIESCASGGGRADYGVLAHTHRIWTSDCTDALERLEIQRGARVFFPPEILGSHVSASPNHQTHRRHTLAFRAIVAMAYHFGVELNPLAMSAEERAEMKDWIALHKRLRPVLHGGAQFDLPPVDGRYVWGAAETGCMIVIAAQGPQMVSEQPPPLRLPGIGKWRVAAMHPAKPDFIRISGSQKALLAGEISFDPAHGISLPMLRPESGVILELAEGA